jgi:hypothetical protein
MLHSLPLSHFHTHASLKASSIRMGVRVYVALLFNSHSSDFGFASSTFNTPSTTIMYGS